VNYHSCVLSIDSSFPLTQRIFDPMVPTSLKCHQVKEKKCFGIGKVYKSGMSYFFNELDIHSENFSKHLQLRVMVNWHSNYTSMHNYTELETFQVLIITLVWYQVVLWWRMSMFSDKLMVSVCSEGKYNFSSNKT
jgi:hypothetical protein